MIVLIAFIAGAVFGVLQARKRQGNRLDMAQYAFGFAVAFALSAWILAIVFERLLA